MFYLRLLCIAKLFFIPQKRRGEKEYSMSKGIKASIKASIADAQIADKLRKFGVTLKDGGNIDKSLAALDSAIKNNEQIRVVKVSVHQPTCKINIGKLTVSKEVSKSKVGEFVEKNGTTTTVICFPGFVQQVRNLASKLRTHRDRFSIGKSDYMDLETYQTSFLPDFLEIRNSLNKLKEDLWYEYEDLLEEFSKGVKELCATLSLNPDEKVRIENSLQFLLNRDKKEFFNSISFELLSDFNADLVDEKDLREVAREAQKMRTAILIEDLIFGTVSDVFKELCSYYSNISNVNRDDLSGCKATKDKVLKKSRQVKVGNVGNSELINKMGDKLIELAAENDKYEGLTLSYYLMADLVGIAREFDIDLNIKDKELPADFTEDILLNEYDNRKKNNMCFF